MKKLKEHLQDTPEQHMRALEFKLNDTRRKLDEYPVKGAIRLGTRAKD